MITLKVTPDVVTIWPSFVILPTWKVGAANMLAEYNTPLSSIDNELLGPINTDPVDTKIDFNGYAIDPIVYPLGTSGIQS